MPLFSQQNDAAFEYQPKKHHDPTSPTLLSVWQDQWIHLNTLRGTWSLSRGFLDDSLGGSVCRVSGFHHCSSPLNPIRSRRVSMRIRCIGKVSQITTNLCAGSISRRNSPRSPRIAMEDQSRCLSRGLCTTLVLMEDPSWLCPGPGRLI